MRYSASVLSLASDSQATIIVKSFINAKVELEKSGFSTLSLISSVPRPGKASWQLPKDLTATGIAPIVKDVAENDYICSFRIGSVKQKPALTEGIRFTLHSKS